MKCAKMSHIKINYKYFKWYFTLTLIKCFFRNFKDQ